MRQVLVWLCACLITTSVIAAPTADDMVLAAKGGDAETIRDGLKSGFDPNYKDRQGNNLLVHAAANSNPGAVSVLLKGGADPLMRNKSGDDALNYGAIKGSLPIVHMMVKAGVPVTRKQGWQPLSYAVLGKSTEVFNYLMDQGADPNGNNPNQVSALMYAAQQGQEAMVDRLLDAGADPTWTKGNESAVDWALKSGNTDIAEKIMQAQIKYGFARSSVLIEPEVELEPLGEPEETPKPTSASPRKPR